MPIWSYSKQRQYQSWDGIAPGADIVIIEKLAARPYYEIQCPVNIKNAGRYPDLASAKRSAFMVELSAEKVGPLLEADGYPAAYIDRTI